jgi:hypothetical protein
VALFSDWSGSSRVPTTKETKPAAKPVATTIPKKAPTAKKLKALPRVTWTPIQTSLSYDDLLARMHIYAFVSRFSPTFAHPLSKAHLGELERVNGDTNEEVDEGELTKWVSENCAKSIVMGLLDVVANDSGMQDDEKKVCLAQTFDVRALTKSNFRLSRNARKKSARLV